MLVELAADQVSLLAEQHSQGVVFGSGHAYLLLSRPDDPDDEWGVYVEYSDRGNAAYDCVESCALDGDRLELKLSKTLGPRCDAEGFRVTLTIPASERPALVDGLRAVFRGRERALAIAP